MVARLHIAKAATPDRAVSPGIGGGQFLGAPVDLDRLRRVFPDRWSAFLHRHFRDRIHVAFFFGVDERTARNWWHGIGAPRAEVALIACAHCPEALAYFVGEAA